MVAIKAQGADSFAKRIDPAICGAVVYGSDAGHIGELAASIAASLAKRSNPPAEILRIEDADLETDPDRLIVELQTVAMFSGGKVIRTSIGRRVTAASLKDVLAGPPPPSYIVIEAGNLKPTDALRKTAEQSAWLAAIPCYPDTGRDLAVLVDEILREMRMTIAPDAREALLSRLGADRALSRNEVEKLALYAHGRNAIELADVEAIVGDASAASLDRIALAVADGRTGEAIAALEHATASGQSPQAALIALQRHFLLLHRVRASIDAGRAPDDALRTLRPPLHFSVRDAVASQLRRWRTETLSHAVVRIQQGVLDARRTSAIETAITERLILELGRLAGGPTRQR